MKRTGSIGRFVLLAIFLAGGAGLCVPAGWAQSAAYGQEMAPPDGPPPLGERGGRPSMRRPGGPGGPGNPMARRRHERQQLLQFRILDRLSRMSPEERERLLSKLPAPRRRSVETNLRRFQQMPTERRAALTERLRQFEQMTPERQEHLRELLRSLGQLPMERRRAIQGEFARIKRMPDEDRLDYTASSAFEQKFNESERELLLDLVDTAPAP